MGIELDRLARASFPSYPSYPSYLSHSRYALRSFATGTVLKREG